LPSGDGLLTDELGRPILVTEGLVLRRAARAVTEAGVPGAVCCDAGGAPAGAPVLTGSVFSG